MLKQFMIATSNDEVSEIWDSGPKRFSSEICKVNSLSHVPIWTYLIHCIDCPLIQFMTTRLIAARLHSDVFE